MYAYAASGAQETAQELLGTINEVILFPLITLMMAVALLIFLYGLFEYVRNAESDSGRETGRRHILWGVIGMLVMLSAMSILYVAAGTFDLDDEIDAARDGGNFNIGD
jgi:NADH:ubiquinone oxidoreductase subunit 2 (subunit N)